MSARGEGSGSGYLERSREVRLGLVMYGGVSLAIYINGVANELFRAVRGRGAYRLVKALSDSDVVVDVLSGASAGGINGILLAYALCNGREFSPAAQLWRVHGDIGELLRPVDDSPDSYLSLLDSEGKYEPWLREAFESLESTPLAGKGDAPSRCTELDLFVTGTDFYGRHWGIADDRGRAIQVKEHRTVFWLKHRAGRKEPFSPSAGDDDRPAGGSQPTHAALARLARITSCFPGAFAPVVVGRDGAVDARLRRWADVKGEGERVYIDGGVLDNKPFSTTLEAVYSRLSDKPVCRWVLYVEPDPERFEPEPKEREAPNVIRAALDSLTSIPGYESIADDLRQLRKHNERVERIRALRQRAEGRNVNDPEGYRRSRLAGLRNHVFGAAFVREADGGSLDPAVHAAQTALREWFDGNVMERDGDESRRCLALDVDFALRRLLFLTYRFEGELFAEPKLLRLINREIELLEIVRGAMEDAVEEQVERLIPRTDPTKAEGANAYDDAWAKRAWDEIWQALAGVAAVDPPPSYAALRGRTAAIEPDLEALLPPKELDELWARTKRREGGRQTSILASCEGFERALLADEPKLLEAYDDFKVVDSVTHPMEVLTGLRSYDVVKIARVSPFDAQTGLSKKPMEYKVTGQRFAHFAAFFKRSWRSNDILWGRLDGACELVDVLLEQSRLRELFVDKTPEPRVVHELERAAEALESGSAVVAGANEERSKLLAWVRDLRSEDIDVRRDAVNRAGQRYGGPKEWLITVAQLEALEEGLGPVYADAASEQLTWNQYPKSDEPAVARVSQAEGEEARLLGRSFVPGKGRLNPSTIMATSAVIAERAMEELARKPGRLEEHFRKEYDVGTETTEDIPPVVVADWISRGLIVAQKSLLLAAGTRADSVQSHPAYQAFFGWPLRAIAGIVGILRREPRDIAGFSLGALLYILLSIVVFVFWRDTVVFSGGGLAMPGGALFVGLPILLVVLLRALAVVHDGAGALAWAARIVGWTLGAGAIAVAWPPLRNAFSGSQFEACIKVMPESLSALCTTRVQDVFVLGPWLVGACLLVGVISVTSGFGAFVRWLRTIRRRRG